MGPNFIFFGGQKYGYRPIPTEIVTSELMQLREVLVIAYFEQKHTQINILICPANTIAEQNGQKYGYQPIPTEIVTSELMQLREVLVIT
jgi:hypothetical protein